MEKHVAGGIWATGLRENVSHRVEVRSNYVPEPIAYRAEAELCRMRAGWPRSSGGYRNSNRNELGAMLKGGDLSDFFMTPSSPAILVVSCDAYRDLWAPFFHCFFKYWPDCPFPVYLGSNHQSYPDTRVQALPIGSDKGYSTNLERMLQRLNREWVIMWIEDFLLSGRVDTFRLVETVRLAQAQDAGYLKLLSEYPVAYMVEDGPPIGELPVGIRYRVSIPVALWRKRVFLELLRPGETAWELERKGSLRSDQMDAKFFGMSAATTARPLIQVINAVVRGKWNRAALAFLRHEGFGDTISRREVLNRRSQWYHWAYAVRLQLLFIKLRRHWWQPRAALAN
jgi:hypothetical protein